MVAEQECLLQIPFWSRIACPYARPMCSESPCRITELLLLHRDPQNLHLHLKAGLHTLGAESLIWMVCSLQKGHIHPAGALHR